MYNRYIPQPDGSWQKNQRQEPQQPRRPQQQQQQQRRQPEQEPPCRPMPEQAPCHEPEPPCRESAPPPCRQGDPVGGFLRRLIPKDFDTGDLLVVLLLLLIAGDNCEDRSTALLTLALYFFM